MAHLTVGRKRSSALASPAVVPELLKRIRADLTLTAAVVAVVLVTSLVFAMLPRLFAEMSDDGLRYALNNAPTYQRNILAAQGTRIPAASTGDQFSGIWDAGQEFENRLGETIQSVIVDRQFVIDSPRYRVPTPPGTQGSAVEYQVTMRYQSAIEDHVQLVDGEWPGALRQTVPLQWGSQAYEVPVLEVALSPETAEQLAIGLGDQLLLEPEANDGLVRAVRSGRPPFLYIRVTGYIRLNDPLADYWFGEPRLDRALEYDDGNRVLIFATAMFGSDAYSDLLAATDPMPVGHSWRFFVDPDRFDAGQLGQIAGEMRRMDAEFGSPFLSRATDLTARSNLSTIFTRYLAERATAESMLAITAIGLLAIAFTVIGLVCVLVVERRRRIIALTRSRGASSVQLLLTQLVEGLLISLPAAVLGLMIAYILVDSRHSAWSVWAIIGIAVGTTGLLVLASLPLVRGNLQSIERADATIRRLSARRLALEVFILALAGAGIYLLRRRGLTADSSAGDVGGFDPYLAAVPVLLGLAAGILVLRLYPLPISVLSWNASMRRDLVPYLAFRRILRQPGVSTIPLLVLIMSISIGVFSSNMLFTIDQGQKRTSWEQVGAPYRVDSSQRQPLYRGIDLSGVTGIKQVASAYRDDSVPVVSTAATFGTVALLAVETDPFAEMNAGTPADPLFPAAMSEPQSGVAIGETANPIPAIASRSWVRGLTLNQGDVFVLNIDRREISFVVRDIRDHFVGMPLNRPFVIAPFDSLQAINTARPPRSNTLYLDAPAEQYEEIKQTLQSQSAATTLWSRDREYEKVHGAPLIAGTVRGFRIGILVAAAYSALAIIVALALTARSRSRDLSYLRTLGLSSRQSLWLTVIEQAPATILAFIVGSVLGIAVARLVEPGLELTAFTGEGFPVALLTDWPAVIWLAIGLVVVVGASVTIASFAARRANLAQALRLGDE